MLKTIGAMGILGFIFSILEYFSTELVKFELALLN
jgi:hypothetical protein